MKNKLEHLLLSLLLGTTVLLVLSFWLNTSFGFNIFYKPHWDELANLQANHIPVDPHFYISFGIAILIFLIGMIAIYMPITKRDKKQNENNDKLLPVPTTNTETTGTKQERVLVLSRPPRLNLPKNIADIASKRNENRPQINSGFVETNNNDTSYNSVLSQIFSENGYTVKPNPNISGFTPNLFAIGNNEIVWIGGVNCDLNLLQKAVAKLKSVFQDTLEDIEIDVAPFVVDTIKKYEPNNDILIVHSIDDLKKFIIENPAEPIQENDKDNFDAYSEYIDTIIQYIKNL